jgi:hypothetical protein
LYEKKLERVNDLFMELNAWKLQLVKIFVAIGE